MGRVIAFFFVLSLLACGSGAKRELASTGSMRPEIVCLEKTTRKSCSTDRKGTVTCACIPDDKEMSRSYP